MEPMKKFSQKVNKRTLKIIDFYKKKGVRLNFVLLFFINLCLFLISAAFAALLWRSKTQKKEAFHGANLWKRQIFFIYQSLPFIILMITAFTINFSFFWWNKKIVEEISYQDLRSQLEVVAENTNQNLVAFLKESETRLKSLILFYNLNLKNLSDKKEQNLLNKNLANFIKITPYSSYFLLDKSSRIILSSKTKKIGSSLKAPPELLSQLKGPKKTALLFPSKDNPNDLFNKNILLGGYLKNKFLLILELPLDGALSQILQNGRFKNSGESYIFNKSAELLSESRFNDQLYKKGVLKEGQTSSLNIKIIDPKNKQFTKMLENALKKPSGVNLTPYNDYRGIPVIGSWIWNSSYKIGLTTEVDAEEAFQALNLFKGQVYSQLIINLILLLILTVVFVWNRSAIAHVNKKLEKAYTAIQTQNRKMEDELNVGRQIQMSMVPIQFPKDKRFSISAKLKPARQLGGDFYSFFFLDKNKICIAISDVSGKGVPSALFMAVTKTLIHSAVFKSQNTGGILSEVNTHITLNNPHCMFATIFIAIVNLETGECEYSNAGHHSSYIKKSDGSLLILNKQRGPAAGAIESFQYTQEKVKLNSGDIIMAYTDGVTEAVDKNNRLYGEKRLENLLSKHRFESEKELLSAVLKDVNDFSKEAYQSDDIALLTLKYS